MRHLAAEDGDAHLVHRFAIAGGDPIAGATMAAEAIFEVVAVSTIDALGACTTAIDIRFRAIEHLIVACGVLTNSSKAYSAFTIHAGFARFAGWTRRTIGAATIDVSFGAVQRVVRACRSGAFSAHANITLAIGIAHTSKPVRTLTALHPATIDVRFEAIHHAVRAFRGRAGIQFANVARALRVIHAFDTSAHSVTILSSVASRSGRVEFMRRRVSRTNILRAWIAIVRRVVGVSNADDVSLAVAGIAFAIAHSLHGQQHAFRRKNNFTRAIVTRESLAFTVGSAVRVVDTLRASRTGRRGRASTAVFTDLWRACRREKKRCEDEESETFRQKTSCTHDSILLHRRR